MFLAPSQSKLQDGVSDAPCDTIVHQMTAVRPRCGAALFVDVTDGFLWISDDKTGGLVDFEDFLLGQNYGFM